MNITLIWSIHFFSRFLQIMRPDISLIISFYKNITWLKLIVTALQDQCFSEFEVIISDDGSPPEVVREVKNLLNHSSLKYQYVWHEDNGFRKTKILNKAVIESNSDYLVFLDGDCVPHRHFLKEHYLGRKEGFVRAGRRVDLTENVSNRLDEDKIKSGYLGWPVISDIFRESFGAGLKALEQGIYIKNKKIRHWINRKDRGIRGHNFSIFKNDLVAVNGFDERFIKAGVGEDTDLEARLRRNGTKILGITKQAIVYHQYHTPLTREDDIYDFYHENNEKGITYTPYGINKLD